VQEAKSPLDLHSKFAAREKIRPSNATFRSEQDRRVRETENALLKAATVASWVEDKEERATEECRLRGLVLHKAVRHDGFAAAVRCVLELEEEDEEDEEKEMEMEREKEEEKKENEREKEKENHVQQQQRKIRAPKRGTHEMIDENFIPTPKVDVNQTDETSKDGSMTALLHACEKGYHDVVNILLGDRATALNQTDADGRR
jgi:hypothetical protein